MITAKHMQLHIKTREACQKMLIARYEEIFGTLGVELGLHAAPSGFQNIPAWMRNACVEQITRECGLGRDPRAERAVGMWLEQNANLSYSALEKIYVWVTSKALSGELPNFGVHLEVGYD